MIMVPSHRLGRAFTLRSGLRVRSFWSLLVAIEEFGALAQLVERLLCKQDVVGSIPSGSTILLF
jgi:hypothetical protein